MLTTRTAEGASGRVRAVTKTAHTPAPHVVSTSNQAALRKGLSVAGSSSPIFLFFLPYPIFSARRGREGTTTVQYDQTLLPMRPVPINSFRFSKRTAHVLLRSHGFSNGDQLHTGTACSRSGSFIPFAGEEQNDPLHQHGPKSALVPYWTAHGLQLPKNVLPWGCFVAPSISAIIECFVKAAVVGTHRVPLCGEFSIGIY